MIVKKVIKFWAPWCGPCTQYAPTFEKVKQELQTEYVEFIEVNVDEDQDGLAAHYKVKGIPCTVILRDGIENVKQAGALTEEQLKTLVIIS